MLWQNVEPAVLTALETDIAALDSRTILRNDSAIVFEGSGRAQLAYLVRAGQLRGGGAWKVNVLGLLLELGRQGLLARS
jgi:hypothetical protein